MPLSLTEANRRRLVVSLLAEEIGRLRRRDVPHAESLAWTDEQQLGEDGEGCLGLDSLGRIDAAGRLNQFFHLHEVGIEDYLLIEKSIGRWCAIVAKSEEYGWRNVTFQTSGSTGLPKTCVHLLDDIAAEAAELSEILARPRRIISLVPPHHIYGFIFTVALPQALGCEVLDARSHAPGQLRAELKEGDLIVATPHLWRYLAMSLGRFPAGVSGASSTAPMPADLARELRDKGLARLVEIYGSSETAGIGWRDDPTKPFRLLDAWEVSTDRWRSAAGVLTAQLLNQSLSSTNRLRRRTRHQAPRPPRRRRAGRRDQCLPRQGEEDARRGARRGSYGCAGVRGGRRCGAPAPQGVRGAKGGRRCGGAGSSLAAPCGRGAVVGRKTRLLHIWRALPVNAIGKLADWD